MGMEARLLTGFPTPNEARANDPLLRPQMFRCIKCLYAINRNVVPH